MASNTQRARQVIEAALATALGSMQVAWPEVAFIPPSSGQWARADILWGESRLTSGGTGVAGNRTTGLLVVSIFDVEGAGVGDLYTAIDPVRDAFSRVQIATTGGGYVQFFAPSGPRVVDTGDQAEWAQLSVSCPFEVKE